MVLYSHRNIRRGLGDRQHSNYEANEESGDRPQAESGYEGDHDIFSAVPRAPRSHCAGSV
jgi:hypothetical protein